MSDVALGVGSGLGQSVANTVLNRFQAELEQRQWRSNQNYLNRQARDNLRDAMTLVKEGYEMAGMSPALAVEGNFSPAQPGSVPLQNKEVPTMDFLSNLSVFAQVKALEAQTTNASATARKANAEAEKQELENDNYKARRDSSKDVSDAWLNDIIEDNHSSYRVRQYAQRLKDIQERYPNLLPENIQSVFGNIGEGAKIDKDYEDYLLDKAIAYTKRIDSDYLSAVRDIDKEQLRSLVQTISNLEKTGDLTDAEIENTKKTLKLIDAQISETKSRGALEDSENIDKLLPQIDGISGLNAGVKSILKIFAIFFGHK